MPWIPTSHATKMSLKKRKGFPHTPFCKEYSCFDFNIFTVQSSLIFSNTAVNRSKIIMLESQPEGKDTILFSAWEKFHDSDCVIFNRKDITSEYSHIPSVKAAVLRIDTGQLNQIFPYDTFHCIVQHVSFSPCGFPADVLQESLSSWRICTRTAGKPAPPELDEGTTCTASKHNFSYMVPALLTHFILRHPAEYQKTSRICHTRDNSLSFLIAYSCLWIKPLLCQNQFRKIYVRHGLSQQILKRQGKF